MQLWRCSHDRPDHPAGQWPEWADRHCWDMFGGGCFYGWEAGRMGEWQLRVQVSELPMPPGHDWRVPVMRPASAQSKPVAVIPTGHPTSVVQWLGPMPPQGTCLYTAPAPAIDLEQFRELLSQWKGSEYPLSYEGTHSQRALNACIADLQALIDGQAKLQASLNEPFGIPEELLVAIRGFIAASWMPSKEESTDEMRATYSYWHKRLVKAVGAMGYAEAEEIAMQATKGDGLTNVRSSSEHSSEVAPGINLEQFRHSLDIAAASIQHSKVDGVRRASGELRRLLAMIEGQADRAVDEAITWGTQFPGKAIKLFGAREIAELNWYPDEGADLVGLRVVERVQPSKGEGE